MSITLYILWLSCFNHINIYWSRPPKMSAEYDQCREEDLKGKPCLGYKRRMTFLNGTNSSRNFWFSSHDSGSMTPPNRAGTSSNLCFNPSCKCSASSPKGTSGPSNFFSDEINVKEMLDFCNPFGSACYRLMSPLPEHGNLWKYGNVFQTCSGSVSPREFWQPQQAPDVWRTLECSLEELYTGSIRQEMITRNVEIDHGYTII